MYIPRKYREFFFDLQRNLSFKSSAKAPEGVNLFLRFGYHKAMTAYFNKVFRAVARENKWHLNHSKGNLDDFYAEVEKLKKPSFLSINNRPIDFSGFPDYRGFHIIRDPRDLLVSGYKYHKWTREKWVKKPIEEKSALLQASGLQRFAGKSYQDILLSLDEESGYLLELKWRDNHFKQMDSWNYQNPRLLEIKYENFIGNELAVFREIFEFFGFNDSMIKKGLEFAEFYSFESLEKRGKTGTSKHASSAVANKWKKELPSSTLDAFYSRFPKLIEKLEYEY